MTEDEIKIANKTARHAGAVGSNALLPRIIRSKWASKSISERIESGTIDEHFEILDFGAGPKAIHTADFARDGYPCTAYEMGENFDPNLHCDDETLGNSTFDIVMASNVINVLSSFSAVEETLKKIHKYTDRKGVALINYPTSPRKCEGLTIKKLMELILKEFSSVMVENNSGTRVFYCYRMTGEEWKEEDNGSKYAALKELES
jgi:hypothetical protein